MGSYGPPTSSLWVSLSSVCAVCRFLVLQLFSTLLSFSPTPQGVCCSNETRTGEAFNGLDLLAPLAALGAGACTAFTRALGKAPYSRRVCYHLEANVPWGAFHAGWHTPQTIYPPAPSSDAQSVVSWSPLLNHSPCSTSCREELKRCCAPRFPPAQYDDWKKFPAPRWEA